MYAEKPRFKGYTCFEDFTGYDQLKPVNVVIGRNNSGKSHMIDFAQALVSTPFNLQWEVQFEAIFSRVELLRVFQESTMGGDLAGNHWQNHGVFLIDKRFCFTVGADHTVKSIENVSNSNIASVELTPARMTRLSQLAQKRTFELSGRFFRRLNAERDIRPEPENHQISLAPNGSGATNLIRRYIHSVSLPRELIQDELLKALAWIFGQDGKFDEIEARIHDEDDGSGAPQGTWEIYLREPKKGLIALSRSGSGLKTVILVLLNLLVVPHMQKVSKAKLVFGFEELENNLHPALLRRLFRYLETYAVKEAAIIFLTTHSSVALDLYGMSPNAQIIHVSHDGQCATARAVSAHLERLEVVSELGAKPSDLLQANGVIWIEGPSDRVHLNHWIGLLSDGKFREGRDYQCAFYAGSLSAQIQFATVEEEIPELANLFRLNSNIVVVCDSDKNAEAHALKDRVQRIKAEVDRLPNAHIWITEAKEIENYLPGEVLGKVYRTASVPDPGQFELFFPSKDESKKGRSFVESKLKRRSYDKVELALLSVPHITADLMRPRFDWERSVRAIIDRIEKWNE